MSQTVQLIMGLLDAAPEMEKALGTAWAEVALELARLCARLDAEGDSSELRRQVDVLIARLSAGPTAGIVRKVLQQVRSSAPGALKKGGLPAPGTVPRPLDAVATQDESAVVIPVWYGTCREWSGSDYTGRRGAPAFGVVRVSVPALKPIGEMEEPHWWKLEFRPDRAKHVYVLDLRPLDQNAFAQEIQAATGDSLVFVHGYNVTFTDAARRAAQLSKDLQWFPRGRTMMYSWPSAGTPEGYTADEASVEWAATHFLEFLRLVVTKGGGAVHLIAHSMGNRAVVRALERFDMAPLGQVVFAAPDVDAGLFVQIAAAFRGRAQRYTLYSSSSDIPLKLSKVLHGSYPRAGNAGDGLVIVDGVDTIDASKADTSMIGLKHSYFAEQRSILSDLTALVVNGRKPEDRSFDLEAAMAPAGKYWLFRE